MFGYLEKNREKIAAQYACVPWREEGTLSPEALIKKANALCESLLSEGVPKPIVKARVFALIMDEAQLAAEPTCFLQDHIRHMNILQTQRDRWRREVAEGPLRAERARVDEAFARGFYRGDCDFGHTAPDWEAVMHLGLPGLIRRMDDAEAAHRRAGTLTEDMRAFYEAARIAYEAAIRYCARLANVCREAASSCAEVADAERLRFCADSLNALARRAPETLQEALQLGYLFHIMQEEIEGERLRSFGGIDRLYRPFYENDLAAGRFTAAQEKELLQHMMLKFYALTGDHLFGEPMYLGGVLPNGESAVNALTDLTIEAFDELGIANPKFHARVAKNSPDAYVARVCDCIRRGNSSFVFLSDEAAVTMLEKAGVTTEEARDYVPIGCYEPCVLGKEVGCTGGAGVNLAKALELALNNGKDPLTGDEIGLPTGALAELCSFDDLKRAVKRQIEYGVRRATEAVCHAEAYYMEINPAPLFSATMEECVLRGADAFAGGAKYNNSSVNGAGQATLADSLVILKKYVYDSREISLERFAQILKDDWAGEALLRARVRRDADKYGNDRALPDALAAEFALYFANLVNGTKNARGGRFKAALISINNNYTYGRKMGATPDGRRAGDPINKNLSAPVTMDRSGVTAHMKSVCGIDHTAFPNGSVLELMFHPTAVAGEEGLRALAGVVRAYAALGGFGLHLNVFDAKELRRAQIEPEKYQNLQVRVCGWNQYFVNLSRAEQDDFIRQAEALNA